MIRIGYPQFKLTALLDALERELLAADADEVRDARRESDPSRNIACQEVRAVLNEAIDTSEKDSDATLPPDGCTGLHRLLWVSRELRTAARCHARPSAFPTLSCRRH
jgi:hypothetical protein